MIISSAPAGCTTAHTYKTSTPIVPRNCSTLLVGKRQQSLLHFVSCEVQVDPHNDVTGVQHLRDAAASPHFSGQRISVQLKAAWCVKTSHTHANASDTYLVSDLSDRSPSGSFQMRLCEALNLISMHISQTCDRAHSTELTASGDASESAPLEALTAGSDECSAYTMRNHISNRSMGINDTLDLRLE